MGLSKLYSELIKKAEKISKTGLDVLIVGEPGSGRDWLVNHISAAIPYEKLDARDFSQSLKLLQPEKKTMTLYLGNIEELDFENQNTLYRMVEKRELIINTEKFNLGRFFFSAGPKLEEKVRQGFFREDLFRKISAVELKIPPLRERKDDILYYTNLFLEELCKKHRKKFPDFDDDFGNFLIGQPWNGNLGELKSFLESMLLFYKGRTFTVKQARRNLNSKIISDGVQIKPGISLEEYEKRIIYVNLQYYSWNRKKTADALGISERNLYRKIKSYNLEDSKS